MGEHQLERNASALSLILLNWATKVACEKGATRTSKVAVTTLPPSWHLRVVA
jgi:hypothetical protein